MPGRLHPFALCSFFVQLPSLLIFCQFFHKTRSPIMRPSLQHILSAALCAQGVLSLPLQKRDSTSGVMSNTTNPTLSSELYSQLVLAPGVVDRFTILANQNNSDFFKFNYNPDAVASHVSIGQGGQGNLANSKSFPALVGIGVAMSMGFMNPCGINSPHIHPRATEFLNIVSGGPVKTGFLLENGLPEQISTVLSLYEAAILPQGSIHYEFNDNCEPAVFVAAFSDNDPGLSSIANNFFSLNPDVVNGTLGYPAQIDATNIATFGPTIPVSFSLGAYECLQRCGIKYQQENNTAQTYKTEKGYTGNPDP